MQRIPTTVEELIEVPVFINMKKRLIADEIIKPEEFKCKAFREIWLGDEDAAIESIGGMQRS